MGDSSYRATGLYLKDTQAATRIFRNTHKLPASAYAAKVFSGFNDRKRRDAFKIRDLRVNMYNVLLG
ncbi:hypothetical protein M3J09_003683 [Ascochyta lentis]